jgi:hypothetical protein
MPPLRVGRLAVVAGDGRRTGQRNPVEVLGEVFAQTTANKAARARDRNLW